MRGAPADRPPSLRVSLWTSPFMGWAFSRPEDASLPGSSCWPMALRASSLDCLLARKRHGGRHCLREASMESAARVGQFSWPGEQCVMDGPQTGLGMQGWVPDADVQRLQ